MLVLFLLGFSAGLPLLLTGQTLQAWLSSEKLDPEQIAALSAVGLAYTFKVVWAPLLDRFRLPWLGRRRGWALAFQVALIVAIVAMGTIDPHSDFALLAAVAVCVAFFAASQDVIVDAYKTDVLAPHERAAGNSAYVVGYRLAWVISGSVALILADKVLSWRATYALMAAMMFVGVIGTLIAEEPHEPAGAPRTLANAVSQAFLEFYRRLGGRGMVLVFAFTALYRFGDFFVQTLNVTFFNQGAGFSLTEIGIVNKGVGFVGTVIGGLFAGSLVARFGLRRMLVGFGVLAAVTNLLFAWLALAGHNLVLFCVAVACDNVTTALNTAAFLSVLVSVCSPAVSATQFAILTSLASVGQRVFGPFAADVVKWIDWSGYFVATAVMALPGLVLAWWIARDIKPD